MTNNYEPILAQAVEGVDPSDRDARAVIYDRARRALGQQLRTAEPPYTSAQMRAERSALEDAIQRVELQAARAAIMPNGPPPRRSPSPPPAQPPPVQADPPPRREAYSERESGDRHPPPPPRRRRTLVVATVSVLAVTIVGGLIMFAGHIPGVNPTGRVTPVASQPALPQGYGIFAIQNGKTVQLSGSNAVADLAPLPKLSDTRLDAAPVTFIIHDKSVQASVPAAKLHVVARVDGLYRINDKGAVVGASDLDPTPWLYRESGLNLNPFPVPGQGEMVQYQASLTAGRYAFRLGNTIYDFLVDGTPADPNLCVDSYEVATPNAQPTMQYRLCNDRLISPVLDLFMRGETWANKGDFTRAIAKFDAALKIDSKYLPALGMRGYIRVLTDNLDGGIADSTAAIDLILTSAGQNQWATPEAISSIYGIRGLAYFKKGDLTRAVADINESIRFNAKNASAYELRARIFLKVGDPKRAVEDAEQFVRLSPTAAAFRLRGEIYKALGRRDEAIADFRRVLSTQLPDQARNEILALLKELGVTL